MTDTAPERIWADTGSTQMWADEPVSGAIEYIRADTAYPKELVQSLEKAKAEIERLQAENERLWVQIVDIAAEPNTTVQIRAIHKLAETRPSPPGD